MTQGQGSYAMELSHYEMVPANVLQAIVARSKVAEEDEE
jgi:elongation factor G